MKCDANCVLSSLKVLMELGVNLLNHILVGPFNVVGKARHMISSRTPWKCIRVLNDSKWSKRSFNSSWASICGIQNFAGRGNKVMGAVKGESVRWTNTSRLLDTRPLRAFIMKSIIFFIICIFATMCASVVSAMDGWLVSCRSCQLRALLPSSHSWSLLSTLVPSYPSLWLLGPTFLLRNYSSRSWFYLVRRSTAVARVYTCLSRAVVRGSSPWLLLVVIEQVSTIQLFVWEVVVWLLSFFPTNGTNW